MEIMCLASYITDFYGSRKYLLAGFAPPSLFPIDTAALAAPAILPLIALPTSAAAALAA
jgi:hypothetical protein